MSAFRLPYACAQRKARRNPGRAQHTCKTNAEHVPHILLLAFAVVPPAHGAGHCTRRAALHRSRRLSTATMCWAAALTVCTTGTGMRCYREPWAHRSSSAPVTARITPLHGAATRHFIEMGTTRTGRFTSRSIY
ncbi:hypothetical protein FB451DRAFT_1418706 [Mycena latifolia]|nr:hypothetical protein FB451DRAFT_1418706 [Mycena latifolia]